MTCRHPADWAYPRTDGSWRCVACEQIVTTAELTIAGADDA